MGKKNKPGNNLGRALIKDRFGSSNKRRNKDSLLHTSEINDGYDWGRLNLQSVTEESSFQEFLSTAQLAGTEFQAEKLNLKFVTPTSTPGMLSKNDLEKTKETHNKHRELLGIPRRPAWDSSTTAEQLQAAECEAFLEWRRRLAQLQEVQGVLLTPYEKNLEFWRQLWRVVERSDVVVQIVDARNPLLFRCEDLEKYVTEVSPHKQNLILLNKADFLTPEQRLAWSEYFNAINVQIAFFSASLAAEEQGDDVDDSSENKTQDSDASSKDETSDSSDEEEVTSEREDTADDSDESGNSQIGPSKGNELNSVECDLSEKESRKILPISSGDEQNLDNREKNDTGQDLNAIKDSPMQEKKEDSNTFKDIATVDVKDEKKEDGESSNNHVNNSNRLLSREELITLFRTLHNGSKVTSGVTTIGLVGYPNVGKSSTINTLLTYKKVSVSATPGKTKHFQTLYLDRDLLLCDCPGLVMPSFIFTKAEMLVNGILPIDRMLDHVAPVTLVASLIPRHILESVYGIMLPPPREGKDPTSPPTAEELLNAYGYNRGFMTQNGQPDNARAARYVLKDFVNGKLLYCHAPPLCNQAQYHVFPEKKTASVGNVQKGRSITENLDVQFFQKASIGAHVRGTQTAGASVRGLQVAGGQTPEVDGKPWKDHRHKRNKREKLRRTYSYLDRH